MADRPILFSRPMVRALLEGRKTQTRRVVKGEPVRIVPFVGRDNLPTHEFGLCLNYDRVINKHVRCPYGGPGDSLWVKETHQRFDRGSCDQHVWYAAGRNDNADVARRRPEIDQDKPWPKGSDGPGGGMPYSVPSIHMPRWASRLTLNVTRIRVERLQDISEADAIAEGLYRSLPDSADRDWFAAYTEEQSGSAPTPGEWENFNAGVWMVPGVPQGWGLTKADRLRDTWGPTPQFCYRLLWSHINGPDSWAANPWVWVVEFELAGHG